MTFEQIIATFLLLFVIAVLIDVLDWFFMRHFGQLDPEELPLLFMLYRLLKRKLK